MREKSLATSGAMASAKIIFRKYGFHFVQKFKFIKNRNVFCFSLLLLVTRHLFLILKFVFRKLNILFCKLIFKFKILFLCETTFHICLPSVITGKATAPPPSLVIPRYSSFSFYS